jgi:hypothetical protein
MPCYRDPSTLGTATGIATYMEHVQAKMTCNIDTDNRRHVGLSSCPSHGDEEAHGMNILEIPLIGSGAYYGQSRDTELVSLHYTVTTVDYLRILMVRGFRLGHRKKVSTLEKSS